MSYALGLAWRNLRSRPVQAAIPIVVVGLAIALSVAVISLADGAERGVVQASDPFGVLIVGAEGSGQQLVLSSVLLQGNPIGNIPHRVYEDLERDPRVQLAVPLAFGDNVGGARIIGTNHNFFKLRTTRSSEPSFQLAQGRLFSEEEHDTHKDAQADSVPADDGYHEEEELPLEAVLGSAAAERMGLHIGDKFVGTHGVATSIAENVHEGEDYTVVGILQPSGTAYDKAVYTQLESVWHVHSHEQGSRESNSPNEPAPVEAPGAAEVSQVTAVLVLPTGFIEQNQLAQQFYIEPTLQAAFPGRELGDLLNLLSQVQQILNIVGYLVLGIAGLTVFLAMYSAILSRQHAIAMMRGLGGSRGIVFRMAIFETMILTVAGAIVGRILGYGMAYLIAVQIQQRASIPIAIRFMPELEVALWVLSISVGFLAGLIPALMAYRVNVIEHLFPQ